MARILREGGTVTTTVAPTARSDAGVFGGVTPRTLTALGVVATAMVFVFDATVELGVAAAVPYAAIPIIVYGTGSTRILLAFATVGSILTIGGWGLSDPGGEAWKVAFNRSLALVLIWTVALLCLRVQALTRQQVESARKRAEELEREVIRRTRALAANAALEDSNADLKVFAAAASHDLKTPLRGVASFATLLHEEYAEKLDATADEFIGHIVQGVERMHRLIDDLLEYASVESRARPPEEVDLSMVLAEVETLLASAIDVEGAVVSHDTMPTAHCDRGALTTLLMNLVHNALKYRSDETPRIHISADRVEHGWSIGVRDNGIGIEERHQARIFEVFKRLHTIEEYPGTGIGLAVCSRIVRRWGGRIAVESKAGGGSTFSFVIPDPPDTLPRAAVRAIGSAATDTQNRVHARSA